MGPLDAMIRSDMFGGNVHAKIHFHFQNSSLCRKFVQIIHAKHQIAQTLYPKKSIMRILDNVCNKIKIQRETNEVLQLAMDQITPLLLSADRNAFIRKFGDYVTKM